MSDPEPDVIAFLRRVVTARQAARRNGFHVDAFTARTILMVYDALSTVNKAKLAAQPLDRMAALAFRVTRGATRQ